MYVQDAGFDAVVVGAGFAGLYALHSVRRLGLKVRALEAGKGVGGTWYWNRYPGARCDIESLEYSYQFSEELQQDWEWTERYASQPEILRYLNHVADRFDLRRDIQFGARMQAALFDEASGRWNIRTAEGERISARWLVMATGCLSRPNKPQLPGLELFTGDVYHTGEWPHEKVDFTRKRVGVIGTGSSAVQSVPLIAREADHVYVFQRTATYSVPAHNGPLDPEVQRRVKADYAGFRARSNAQYGGANFNPNETGALAVSSEQRRQMYDERWARGGLPFMATFADLVLSKAANDTAIDYLQRKIHEIVRDPATAEQLSPRHTFACKRLCVDTGYYEAFNRQNVTLVDVRSDPIETLTRDGIDTSNVGYKLDCIVSATGFDAMTGALLSVDIRGRGGVTLQEAWRTGPRTYLGVATAGFPNFFTISGPGSPSVLSNMVATIEQHVNWIAGCVAYMERKAFRLIEATLEAQDAWVEHGNACAESTLYPSCSSWYLGANVPGKPRVFMPYTGGFPAYIAKCNEVAANGYEGFVTSSP
jgi:cation diffusion facilitator CzcD-associated flavoprotein CzcO